jgi:hypothetical protein
MGSYAAGCTGGSSVPVWARSASRAPAISAARSNRPPGVYAAQYGQYGSLADLLRQIGHDERTHKQGSLTNMRTPRLRQVAKTARTARPPR